jgi:hypothetical protein
MAEDNITRCAHKDCTCHAQEGAEYCSDSCREAAKSGASGCRCGHASCTGTVYLRSKSGEPTRNTARSAPPQSIAARHSHSSSR